MRARGRTGPGARGAGRRRVAGVVAFAYWRIASGFSTVGDFMGFITALLLAAQPIKSLGTVTTTTLEGLAAAERVYELLDEKPNVVDRPGARPLAVGPGAIVFDDVELRLCHGGRQAGGAGFLARPCRAARRWRWSAARAPASRPSSISCARLFDVDAGRIRSTARTCAR